MTRMVRIAALLAAAAWLLGAAAAVASEKLAGETGKSCTTCHDKPGSKLLTDTGKYFETTRSFEGYDKLKASFGRCTTCHVRQPGSARLTRRGKQFADMVKDMSELKRWMDEGHPMPAAK